MGVFLETQAIIFYLGADYAADCDRFWYGIRFLLGIIMVVNTSVGMITPPMAVNLFVASSLVKQYNVTIEHISKYALRFLLIEIIDIFIVVNFPAVSLGLLGLLK